jgi:hypothetical protein
VRERHNMNSEYYLRPVLVGERFEGHAIPLEMLRDLAVLEEMVVEVAKWHFLNANPKRKRAPRGFADGISLALTAVENGSAAPIISLVFAGSLLFDPSQGFFEQTRDSMLFHPSQSFFEQARDSIVGVISAAAANKPVTGYLPEKTLAYFDRFGRSLRDGESIEFPSPNADEPARLTKEVRRKLLLASPEVKELTEEIRLRGAVHEANQEAMTFQITLPDGSQIPAPIAAQHFETIMEAFAGYKHGAKILVQGVGKYNRLERLQSIDSIEHVTILDAQDVPARLGELRTIKDGWLDGSGFAPSKEGLIWLEAAIMRLYPDSLPLPYIYPVPTGGVQLEWPLPSQEASLEIDLNDRAGEWHALNMPANTEEFQVLDLSDDTSWKWVIERLEGMAGAANRD